MHPTYRQEFRPQVRIAVVGTPPERGARQRHDLAYAPHLCAEVMGFEVDGDPVRLEHRLQGIGDLLPDALLYSKALGKQAHEPGELGDTDDVLMCNVAHVGMSVKRQRMVLTERKEVDRPLNHLAQTTVRPTPALGLTDNAIRAHLATLERDGIVQQRGVRRGGGKPASVYDLAPEAEQLFPKAYGPVLQQLLDVLDERIPTSEVETLLREIGRRIASMWKVPSGDLRVRLGAAVEDFNELGGMAELEACDGHFCIRSYSCPLADVVLEHPEVCHLAETLLTELVGVPVQKHCDYTGSPRCSFTVPNT